MRLWLSLLFFSVILNAKIVSIPNYNPFSKTKQMIKPKSSPISVDKKYQKSKKGIENAFNVVAIFNNKAFIGGRFYSVGDRLMGYKVIEISNKRVVLKNKKHKKIISLADNKPFYIKTKPKIGVK